MSDMRQLREYKERNEMIVDQLSTLLKHEMVKQKAVQLLKLYDEASRCLESLQHIQREQQNEQKIVDSRDFQLHKKELEDVMSTNKERQERIAKEKKAAISHFQYFCSCASEIKTATLLHKENKLLQNRLKKLQETTAKFRALHDEKSMFREIQAKKESDDAEYIFNKIAKETKEQIKMLRDRREKLKNEVARHQSDYKMIILQHEKELRDRNQRKIQEILASKKVLQTAKGVKPTSTVKDLRQANASKLPQDRPFQADVVFIQDEKKHYKLWNRVLIVLTVLLMLRVLIK